MKPSSAFLPIDEFNALQACASDGLDDGLSPFSSECGWKRERDLLEDELNDSTASSSSSMPNMDVVPRQIGLEVFRMSCRASMDHRLILGTLVEKEKAQMPDPTYMTTIQHQLKPKMTAILCEWLVDVCSEDCLGFSRNTLDCAIRNIERYLSKHAVSSSEFQLVGAASLLIAYKLNERYQKNIVDLLVEFGGEAYTKAQLFDMERMVAIALEWKLLPVIAHEILEIMVDAEHQYIARSEATGDTQSAKRRRCESTTICSTTKTDENTWCMMQDVLYVSQTNYAFLEYAPSVQAAGAYCFAKRNQMASQQAFTKSLSFCKDLLDVKESDVMRFVKQLETCGEEGTQDKTRSATPQSVAAGADDAGVFAD